jgi:molecular chaperone IbpA
MTSFDFSPLFRSTVGFDRMMRLLDSAASVDEASSGYPPYNIEKRGEDAYRITMAVAGFGEDDLNIETREGSLVVTGRSEEPEGERTYLHRGIARRAFKRSFQLADHVRVSSAELVDGLLHIDLVREVPEAMKPRTIEITKGAAAKKLVGGRKAA